MTNKKQLIKIIENISYRLNHRKDVFLLRAISVPLAQAILDAGYRKMLDGNDINALTIYGYTISQIKKIIYFAKSEGFEDD